MLWQSPEVLPQEPSEYPAPQATTLARLRLTAPLLKKFWTSEHLQSVCKALTFSVKAPWAARTASLSGLAAPLCESALRSLSCGAGLQRTCAAAGRQDVHPRREHVHAAPRVAPGVQPCTQPRLSQQTPKINGLALRRPHRYVHTPVPSKEHSPAQRERGCPATMGCYA